jgi:hypothetical protein
MTRRTPVAVTLTLLALAAITMLRSPVSLGAQVNAQRPNLGVPHQDAPAPAVLALSIQGQPTLVSPSAPVPVTALTPIPITIPAPVVVNDGSQIIKTTGDYTFIFAGPVTLPKMAPPVNRLDVRVVEITGKWVTAEYRGSQGSVRMLFNTQALLGIAPAR